MQNRGYFSSLSKHLVTGAAAVFFAAGLQLPDAYGTPYYIYLIQPRPVAKVESPSVVTSGHKNIVNTAISENWIAWEDSGKIWCSNRTDLSAHHQLTAYGSAHCPDLDGDTLAYEENGGIFLKNLPSGSIKTIYVGSSSARAMEPKINGDYLIFGVKRDTGQDSWYEIYACRHTDRRPRPTPIASSNNPKKSYDINGKYAVWAELNDKENSTPNLAGGGDWDILGCDLSDYRPLVIDDSPYFSTGFCAVNDDCVVYSQNIQSVSDTLEEYKHFIESNPQSLFSAASKLKTYLVAHNFDTGKRIKSRNVVGEIRDPSLHGNLLVYRQLLWPFGSQQNPPDRVRAMFIEDKKELLEGFPVRDEGGNQMYPDVYKDPNGIGHVVFVNKDYLRNAQSRSGPGDQTEEIKDALLSVDVKISTEPADLLGGIYRNWLKMGTGALDGDLNGDSSVNFKDFSIAAMEYRLMK